MSILLYVLNRGYNTNTFIHEPRERCDTIKQRKSSVKRLELMNRLDLFPL